MRHLVLSCISSLLFSSVVYAADCVTSFDQSCFSQSYKQQEIDEAYENRQDQMEDSTKRVKEHNKALEKVAQEQAKAEAEWRKEMREQDRLTIESEKVEAMHRQTRALEGLRGDIREQERALGELQRDIQLRDLSR
jgi:Skp family chaperone for outer membrane proteins